MSAGVGVMIDLPGGHVGVVSPRPSLTSLAAPSLHPCLPQTFPENMTESSDLLLGNHYGNEGQVVTSQITNTEKVPAGPEAPPRLLLGSCEVPFRFFKGSSWMLLLNRCQTGQVFLHNVLDGLTQTEEEEETSPWKDTEGQRSKVRNL